MWRGLPNVQLALVAVAALQCVAISLLALGRRGGGRTQFHRPRKHLRVLGVIPARYASTRFPGKALVAIRGVPMIVRTFRQAVKATLLDCLVVATDDHRILHACQAENIPVVSTSVTCNNGTERCLEAVNVLEKVVKPFDIVINIQGDEPLIEPHVIDAVVQTLMNNPDAVYSTACTPLPCAHAGATDRVKCVVDQHNNALYFSRSVIPGNKAGRPRPDTRYLLHLGLQCYDRRFLSTYCALPATPLQLSEDLEQLKVLENGYKMKVVVVNALGHGVDQPSDVAVIENLMVQRGIA